MDMGFDRAHIQAAQAGATNNSLDQVIHFLSCSLPLHVCHRADSTHIVGDVAHVQPSTCSSQRYTFLLLYRRLRFHDMLLSLINV
jgi:hypothetical protein